MIIIQLYSSEEIDHAVDKVKLKPKITRKRSILTSVVNVGFGGAGNVDDSSC
ncbi:MAG: hypothetical protein KAQ91_07045 [Methylococcales bacterium]|nr:hypothetical protein [Methylococcales bacterium]